MRIGIIGGAGAMGSLYADQFVKQGYTVNVSDMSDNNAILEERFGDDSHVRIMDGHDVSRNSDMIFYSVPAFEIGKIVEEYAPSTSSDALIAGLTSVKAPEIKAFDQNLPNNPIVTGHSLHGPGIKTSGKNLVVMRYRSSDEQYNQAMEVYRSLESKIIEMPWEEHDKSTADSQVITHLGFLSMGTAWKERGGFPWENGAYMGGIDNAKILMMLRIYGGTPHVYSGLAILNPNARVQAKQYADSTRELLGLMIDGNLESLRTRIMEAGEFVFRDSGELILDDNVLGDYSLGGLQHLAPNSNLAPLAMIDSWHKLGINPYANKLKTPVFNARLGIAEYLFRNLELLEKSFDDAVNLSGTTEDDIQFNRAVHSWYYSIRMGAVKGYHQKFEETRKFFEGKLDEGKIRSTELISKLGL